MLDILKRLNFSDDELIKLFYLIEQHDNPIKDKEIIENYEIALMKFKIQLPFEIILFLVLLEK